MFSFSKPLLQGKINYVVLGWEHPNERELDSFPGVFFLLDLLIVSHPLQYVERLCNIIAR